jgi:pimeloyl-ACP methyl ester carboxylesterase
MKNFAISPDWQEDVWYNFKRYKFEFEGRNAWVVVPDNPAGDGRWSWCAQWAEAFVERVATTDLLAKGFHHAHIDVFDTKCNAEGVEIMKRFQDFLVARNLSPKVNLIGMSWGGYFSLRYATSYPEKVRAIYLDAPVCNSADCDASAAERVADIVKMYNLSIEELKTSELNPLNSVKNLKKYNIPFFIATGEDDLVVKTATNINLLENELKKYEIPYTIIRRPGWGHHPHGFDNRTELIKFHESSCS